MTWRTLRPYVLGFSIGLNVAFVGIWLFYSLPLRIVWDQPGGHRSSSVLSEKENPGWWFYHEKIGVSDTQWQDIEPDLKAFHRNAFEICRKLGNLRNQLLNHLAQPVLNQAAIDSINRKILALRDKKQTQMIEYFIGKKDLLTNAQQTRFFEALRKNPRCWKHARFLDNRSATPPAWKRKHTTKEP